MSLNNTITKIRLQIYIYGELAELVTQEINRRGLTFAEAGRQAFRLWLGEPERTFSDELDETEGRLAATLQYITGLLGDILAKLEGSTAGDCPHCGR